MGIRTAFSQARIVTIGVFFAAIWVILTMLQVYNRMGPLSSGSGVGQTPISGVIGLIVLGGLLALLLTLYGELSEADPAPEPWE